jgi:hypothetical protein
MRSRDKPEPYTHQPNREQAIHARINTPIDASTRNEATKHLRDVVCERSRALHRQR